MPSFACDIQSWLKKIGVEVLFTTQFSSISSTRMFINLNARILHENI